MKILVPFFVMLAGCYAVAQSEPASITSYYELIIEGNQARIQYRLMEKDPLAKRLVERGITYLSVKTKDGSWLSCTDFGSSDGIQCVAKIRGIVAQ